MSTATVLLNVHIPYIDIYVQIEVDSDTALEKVADRIQQAIKLDYQLKIFRFKKENDLILMNKTVKELNLHSGDPRDHLKAFVLMEGA